MKAPPPTYLRGLSREPGVFADVAVQLVKMDVDKMQQMLEIGDVVTRLEMVLAWMKAAPPPA